MNMLLCPYGYLMCARVHTFLSFGLMQGGDTQQPPGANHPRPRAGIFSAAWIVIGPSGR
jgi:hypothetical protein